MLGHTTRKMFNVSVKSIAQLRVGEEMLAPSEGLEKGGADVDVFDGCVALLHLENASAAASFSTRKSG